MIKVDDLKCCGNCSFRHRSDNGNYYEEGCKKDYNVGSNEICIKYKYDRLKFKERLKND